MTLRPRAFSRPRLLALPLAVTAALALSSCGMSGGPDQAPGADPRVRLAMLQPPRSGLSPYSDDAFKLSRWSVTETLVRLDADGVPQPGLATAWTQENPTTWRFSLRPGVMFHDGTPMTPQAVATSLTKAATATPVPRILNKVDLKASVDGDRVVVTTAKPDPLLPNRLSSPQLPILAAKAYAGQGVDMIGTATGPFRITRIDGVVGASMDRFDGYWGEKAKASGIDAKYVNDGTARGAALRTGEADIVEAVPVSQTALIDKALMRDVQMPRTNTVYLNMKSGPFADPGVRAAARVALDRTALVDSIYEGRADAAKGLLGPALPWTSRRGEITYAAPGQPQGKTITFATYSDRAELPEGATAIVDQWKKAGFVVNQVVREYSQMEADALAGKFDAVLLSRATVLDSGDPVAYMQSDFGCGGGFNIAQMCDPAIDAALAKAATLPAGKERQDAILAVEQLVLKTDGALPVLHERVIQGGQAGVVDAAYDPRERELVTAKTTVRK